MQFTFAYTRLLVEDYPTCLQFYRDVLGLTVKYEDPENQYAELETGDTILTLIQRHKVKEYFGEQTAVVFGQQDDGIALSFQVQDVDRARQYLMSKGVEFLNEPWKFTEWGIVTTLFRDPDGNLVELLQSSTDILPK
ncbi:MAG: VOC family protein [Cyanophyceae cyanobacterium]